MAKLLKLFKSSKRLKAIAEAETLFLDIIEGDIISHEITALAMIHYLEILFVEMRILQNDDIMEQIKKYIKAILIIAQKQKSVALMIEIHILNSSVALMTLNSEVVNNQLKLALELATRHDIRSLLTKIKNEQNRASEFMKRLDKQLESQSSLSSRIDEIDIMSYLNDVSKVVRSLY